MPTHTTYQETYWCPGPWPWQWFRRCKRNVTGWCYFFERWSQTTVIFVSKNVACENGRQYSWWGAGFAVPYGVINHIPQQKCFKDKLDDEGPCEYNDKTPK